MTTERVTQEQARESLELVVDDLRDRITRERFEQIEVVRRFIAQHPDDPASEHSEAPMSQPVRVGMLGHIGADKSALTAAIAQTAKARESDESEHAVAVARVERPVKHDDWQRCINTSVRTEWERRNKR